MQKQYLDLFIEMEREGINPFGHFGNLSEAESKVRLLIQHILNNLEPTDELYFMKHRFEQVLKCPFGKILGNNNSDIYVEEDVQAGDNRVKSIWIRTSCDSYLCIRCSIEERERKVDKLNYVIDYYRNQNKPTVMVTIINPTYLNTSINERERVKLFSKAIKEIMSTPRRFKELFYTDKRARFNEMPLKVEDFKAFNHSHFVLNYLSREDKKRFMEKFDKFKEYVYKIMAKYFDIRDKEYYRENCAYINTGEGKVAKGEEDIVELEDADYLKKSYGTYEKRFKKWGEERVNRFKQLEHFDEVKGIFTEINEEEEGEVRKFYSEEFGKMGRNGKCFCLQYEELIWIGGDITKEDLALKESDYRKYSKIMYLKTWALRIYLKQLSYLYDPNKARIARRPVSIGRNYYKDIEGGVEEIERVLKEELLKKRREKEESERRISREGRMREEKERRSKDKQKEMEKAIISNKKHLEEIREAKKSLLESVGINFELVEDEIFYRSYRILRVGMRLHRYLSGGISKKTKYVITNLNWLECIKNGRGSLDRREGLKRLYEMTEEYGLDRGEIYISEYIFEGDEYAKYFPKKIESNKRIDKQIEERLGMSLREYDNLENYYEWEEMKEVLVLLKENSNKKGNTKENTNKILEKIRG